MASSNSPMASPSEIAMEVDEMPNEEEDEKMDIDMMDEMPNLAGGEDEELNIDTMIQMFRSLSLDDEMEWD